MASVVDSEKLHSDLSIFRESQDNHAQKLNIVLEDYSKLIEAYRNLKSEYEETWEAREKWKRTAREYERNPIVLVLIDGDNYVFKDQFLNNRGEGGVEAALELHKQIEAQLTRLGDKVDRSQIMVRIYANMKGLSQTLARAGLCGNESRAIAAFACNFTRAQELFDFVDAGEGKEGADFKINAMFKLYVENPQCKHIFFAGCHDEGYINGLTRYSRSAMDRITLVKGSYLHPKFQQLGFEVIELPTVFRATPLENGKVKLSEVLSRPVVAPVASTVATKPQPSKEICPYYQKGKCWYPDKCKFSHERSSSSEPETATSTGDDSIEIPRNGVALSTGSGSSAQSNISSSTEAQIPTNASGFRVDIPLTILPGDAAAYYARVKKKRLCNDHHLAGSCTRNACEYDHSSVEPEVINKMREVVRSCLKCPKATQCRSRTCYKSHGNAGALVGSDKQEVIWVRAED